MRTHQVVEAGVGQMRALMEAAAPEDVQQAQSLGSALGLQSKSCGEVLTAAVEALQNNKPGLVCLLAREILASPYADARVETEALALLFVTAESCGQGALAVICRRILDDPTFSTCVNIGGVRTLVLSEAHPDVAEQCHTVADFMHRRIAANEKLPFKIRQTGVDVGSVFYVHETHASSFNSRPGFEELIRLADETRGLSRHWTMNH